MRRLWLLLLLCACASASGPDVNMAARTQRVWFLGDSITQLAVEPGGFRKIANDMVVAGRWPIDFAGDRNDGAWTDNAHSGFPTGTTQYGIDKVAELFGPGKSIVNAKAVAIMLGTNDARDAGYNGATSQARMTQLLNDITAADPVARIILGTFPNINPAFSETEAANGNDMNNRIRAVRDAYDLAHPPNRIAWWDPQTILGPWNASLMLDEYHPNADGNTLLGTAFRSVAQQAISPGAGRVSYSFGAFR